jgi:hypothetical protein
MAMRGWCRRSRRGTLAVSDAAFAELSGCSASQKVAEQAATELLSRAILCVRGED